MYVFFLKILYAYRNFTSASDDGEFSNSCNILISSSTTGTGIGLIAKSRRISSRRDSFRLSFRRRFELVPEVDNGSVRLRLPCPFV
jgi:hypothetical protein